jgi:hypothetical protein
VRPLRLRLRGDCGPGPDTSGACRAITVAIIAGGVTLTIGQIAFATIRSPLIRGAIGLLHAVPAAIAGYNGTLDCAQMGIPSQSPTHND